ncbi:dapper homolog 2 [Latimeria chalumnae]|uniref:dapper homolog 2 n=1 Tax=Latimeria chalumnae TaxID=7897 RepID=UPI0003C14C50|nr:PREDICTED: dapper homolog 2-like [Latimeria chalumnae]|eukprot:XP_005988953.1 PREDICTED: dapper homolog 2-like [Latimeria chalumnae]
MSRRAGLNSLWSGNDRIRIGERLQASLAGILELEVLKTKQKELVEKATGRRADQSELQAVGMQNGDHRGKGQQRVEEQAAVSCLKRDQSRSEDLLGSEEKPRVCYHSSEHLDSPSRAGDPGFGMEQPETKLGRCGRASGTQENPLQPRRQPIATSTSSEILDLHKKSSLCMETRANLEEGVESDSRPSSGFYEVSDSGSCSLSNSCTSVYSEGPGTSHWSILSLSQLPASSEPSCTRPRSTDEAAVRLINLRLQQLLAGSGAEDNTDRTQGTNNTGLLSKVTRRPFSTGDLEFIHRFMNVQDISSSLHKSFICHSTGLDPKYKCDLISRNTNEVYHYPSPLHAVALQSPLFITNSSFNSSKEDLQEDGLKPPAEAKSLSENTLKRHEVLNRTKLDKYISKLVLRYKCRSAASHIVMRRSELSHLGGHQKSLSMSSICSSNSSVGPGQLISPVSGWKLRRRISTCCQVRSPEGPEGSRDSYLDKSGRSSVISFDVGCLRSSLTDLSKANECSMGLPQQKLDFCKEETEINELHSADKLRYGGDSNKVLNQDHNTPVQYMVWVRKSTHRCNSLRWVSADMDALYKGKHASRELVKAATLSNNYESAEKTNSIIKKDIFRRISLRKKPSAREDNRSRSRSEMNLNMAVTKKSSALYKCESQDTLSEAFGKKGKTNEWKKKPKKQKWMSVLEISNRTPETFGFSQSRTRKSGFFSQAQAFLSRHRAFSTDCPSSFHSPILEPSQTDLQNTTAHYLYGSESSLSEVDATSCTSLNRELIHEDRSIARPHLGEKFFSNPLDNKNMVNGSIQLYRTKSFKELKKRVSRSMRPFSFKGTSSTK